MRCEVSRGLVVVGGFVSLTSLFLGCQSRMAACDCEPLVEKTVKSLDNLSVARWTVATRIDKPSWEQQYYKDYISSYCGSKAVFNQVMATARLSEPGESSLPVKVSISSNCKNDDGTLTDIWNVPAYLTLGTLPVMESEKVTYTIRAVTVVGRHEKTVEICNRKWASLFTPFAMIPVPGWADFRTLELGDSRPSDLKGYHEKTIAASVVQLLSETAEVDWPKYINDRAQYDKILSLERSEETIRAAFDLIKDIRRDGAIAMREGKVVRFSKYKFSKHSRKGKYKGERYKIVGHPCISEYQEYDSESEARNAIANATSDLRRQREKVSQDELKVVEKLAEVKEVDIIEKYEEQIKKEVPDARSEELKEALANLLDKVRLKRKRIEADKLVAQRNWKQLRALCIDEKDGEFVSTYSPKAEAFRVEELRKEMEAALTKGDWQHVLARAKGESDEAIKALVTKAEQMRLEKVRHEINDALTKGHWQHALMLSRNESDEAIKALAAKAKECGIKEKGAEAEALLAKEQWSEVLDLCEKLQSEIELAEFTQQYRTKAEKLRKSIEQRNRAAELKRIESRKNQISRLLDNKDYATVIAECDKERGENPGAMPEDQDIWISFKNRAVQAKAKIDRETELRRISEKIKLIEELLEKKDYDAAIKACEEECGTNVGSLPEDMAQWKAYRSKALGLRLLAKANGKNSSEINIKGFYLGMSMEEVEILLRYYVPSISFERKDNLIKIKGHEMAFCQAENGKVVRINLDKKILEKMFDYDVQTTREWAAAFAKEFSFDFRTHTIRDRKSKGIGFVSVSQGCYVFKDRRRDTIVTIFDEQDVDDRNRDPKEMVDAANSRSSYGYFGDEHQMVTVFDPSVELAREEAEREAKNINYVRDWIRKTYVNEKGAEEGTLRLEVAR